MLLPKEEADPVHLLPHCSGATTSQHNCSGTTTPAQEHVKATTAPYKYPRKVEFVASGKIRSLGSAA